MARLDPVIAERARRAVRSLAEEARVEAAFVFGSRVDGTPDQWSDIDIAAFVQGLEEWDIERRAQASARVQGIAGDDIELHLFPAVHFKSAPKASFAAYVQRMGVQIET